MTKKIDPKQYTRLGKLPEYECALADAVRLCGSKTALARALGLGKVDTSTGQVINDRQVVSEWFRRGAIPRQYVMPIHELTGIALEKLLIPFKPYRPSKKDIADELAAEMQQPEPEKAPAVPDVMDSLKKKPRARSKREA